MVVRIQISFETIKLGEGKEDLTAIELRIQSKYTDFFQDHQLLKGESLFLWTQVELKYRKEELEHFDNLREISLLLSRPLY